MPKIVLKQSGKNSNSKQGITVYTKKYTPVLKTSGNRITITTPAKILKTLKK